jgi:hypothetical protein
MAAAAAARSRYHAARASPPRSTRFGSPLVLSRVHWVRPELVAESSFSPGPTTICCGRSSMRLCARTSRRPRSADRCRMRNPLRPFPRGSCRSDRRRRRGTDETAQTVIRIRRHICARIRCPGNALGVSPRPVDQRLALNETSRPAPDRARQDHVV